MSDKKVDIAIVGGGISGVYSAWRLQQAYPEKSIVLFERANSLGGRIWTEFAPGVDKVPMELGATWFSRMHLYVYPLIVDKLNLPIVSANYQPGLYYLRGSHLNFNDFENSNKVPYQLDKDEEGKNPYIIFWEAIQAVVTGIEKFIPLTIDNYYQAYEFLQNYQVDGVKLYQWGFWNLLSTKMSNEAHELLASSTGANSEVDNANAFDSIWQYLIASCPDNFRIRDGYQLLPDTLGKNFEESGGKICLRHSLSSIEFSNGDVELTFEVNKEQIKVCAEKVIGSMPPAALKAIRIYENSKIISWPQQINAVYGVPFAKLFTVYERPWWQDVIGGPGQISINKLAISYTNLPLLSCYYLGASNYADSGRALMIGSFADCADNSYWSGYCESERFLPVKSPLSGGKLENMKAPQKQVDALQKQLKLVHQYDVPEPIDAWYHDWAPYPWGGAVHQWRPWNKSWEVAKLMMQPIENRSLYTCGEAFSEVQGWVEGALSNTEMLLQSHFALDKPEWVSNYNPPIRLVGTGEPIIPMPLPG